MENLQYLVFVGAAVSLVSTFFYIKLILEDKAQPSIVSWFMWFLATFVGSVISIYEGGRLSSLPIVVATIVPLLVFIATFYKRNYKFTASNFDYACGILSFLALVIWLITRESNFALWLAIIGDFLAAIPTIKNAWLNPEKESPVPYFGYVFNQSTTFAAVKIWAFPVYGFSLYLIILNFVIMVLCLRKYLLPKYANSGN